jgi:hypothetical protein
MNSLSALEMKFDDQTKTIVRKFSLREIFNQVGTQSIEANIDDRNLALSSTPEYRLGEAVYHGLYGVGQIMAHLPDGRLQIRFDGVRKSRMIFPSLINRC